MDDYMRQKSLKHKPGAMKKKAKLDALERERFARNLAQMATALNNQTGPHNATPAATATATETETETGSINPSVQQTTPSAGTTASEPTAQRWAALRNFISHSITPASHPGPGVSS